MSYHRGNMRRDSGRRSNDFGGGGNRRGGGNYLNSYDNYSSPMNPWEGGMVPGRSSTLPSTGQGDLLSQLTSPEAQLALASNLINKLINQQQQSVPSLLSLGNMGSGGGHMSSFNDGYGNTRNFQDRRRERMDQRRTEPYYNKSGMNRRMGTDRHYLGRNHKTSFSKSPKVQKEDKDKKDKDAEKANGDVKSESADESKREKKEDEVGEDNENKGKKEIEKKAPPIPAALLYCHVCCKNMWDETSFTKHLKGRFHQLMMDGLNEKYKLKVDLLRHEMRLGEKQRDMELERRQQRHGMSVYNLPREYCAMCDLHFYGNLISHRKNIRHQKLKAFLHPKCSHCNKEFSTRLEWDDHRLSFSHLKKVADFRRATKPNIKDDEFDIDELVSPDSVNCGEMVTKEIPVLMRHQSEDDITGEIKEEPLKDKEEIKKEVIEGEEGKTEEIKNTESKDKEEEKTPEAPQGIDVDPTTLPRYDPSVVIGKDLLIAVAGFVCRVCNRFLQGDEGAHDHCLTRSHYNNYCNIVRAKAHVTGRRKRGQGKFRDRKGYVKKGDDGKNEEEKDEEEKDEEEKDEEEKEADETTESEKLETPAQDDEGNWKRRKNNENDEEMEVDEAKQEIKDEIPDGVWEEVEKDVDGETPKEGGDNIEEEQEDQYSSPSRRAQRGGRGGGRGRRGGKRGK